MQWAMTPGMALSMSAIPPVLRETIIEPATGITPRHFTDVWEYRELLWFLVWRDIKVRYKQTVIGAAWALIQPIATTVDLLDVVRSHRQHAVGRPAVSTRALASLVPFGYFSAAVSAGSNALIANQQLISKVYSRGSSPPRRGADPLVDFAIGLALLVVCVVWFGIVPSLRMLWIAVFMLLEARNTRRNTPSAIPRRPRRRSPPRTIRRRSSC